MQKNRMILACAICLGVIGFGGTARVFAQKPPARNSQLTDAKKRVTEAQAALTEARGEQKRLKDKARADFESKGEWKKTATNFRKAKSAYESARKKALSSMQASPLYKQKVEEREALKLKLDELQNARNPSPDAITKAGSELAEVGMAIKKMETEAMASDEKASEAKATFDESQKEFKALDDEIEDYLQSDPEYQQNEVAVAQAQEGVDMARKSYSDMQKAEAQARASQQKTTTPKTSKPKKSRSSGVGGY